MENENCHFLFRKYFHMVKIRKIIETGPRSVDLYVLLLHCWFQMKWYTNHDGCMIESNNRLKVFIQLKAQILLSEYKILNVKINKNL